MYLFHKCVGIYNVYAQISRFMIYPIVAFDESGNTGQNLLDPNQPYFALASVHFESSELAEILDIFDSSAIELHFKSLKKYTKSRNQIIQFCNLGSINYSNVKYYVADKKYSLIAHIVDRFIEPVMYNMGKDIVKDRSNIVMANVLYSICGQSKNKALVDDFLSAFQTFIREPSDETIQNFYASTSSLNKPENPHLFLDMIESSRAIKGEIISGIESYSIDLTLPLFIVLADRWNKEFDSKFEITHDDSKAVDFWQSLLSLLSDSDKMENKEVGFGENKMTYPLNFTKLELVDSKRYPQVQVADLIASAICFGLKNLHHIENDAFVSDLWSSKLFKIFNHSLMPTDSETLEKYIREGDQDGNSSLDYLAEMRYNNK